MRARRPRLPTAWYRYLVKPFGRGRFLAAVQRVRRRLEQSQPELPLELYRAQESLAHRPLTRLFARKGSRIVNVPLDEVVHISASGDYAEVHLAKESCLVQVPLAELEERLDQDRFWRIHRSHLINLDHVERMEAFDDRRLVVVLRGGRRVLASRTGSRRLRELVR